MSDATQEPDEDDAEWERLFQAYGDAEGDPARQEELSLAALVKASEWAETRLPTDEDRLREETYRCMEEGDWPGAERAHRALVALAAGNPMQEWRALDQLRTLLECLGRTEEAGEVTRAATKAARQSDLRPLIWNALQVEAAAAVAEGNHGEALRLLEEAFAASDGLRDWQDAALRVLRAHIRIVEGDLPAADADLAAARKALAPYETSMHSAGPVSRLIGWWRTTGSLHTARQQSAEATAAYREALAYARRVAEMPQLEGIWPRLGVADALSDLAGALESVGQHDEAERRRGEAAAIRRGLHLPGAEDAG